jgi:hypothetical protein
MLLNHGTSVFEGSKKKIRAEPSGKIINYSPLGLARNVIENASRMMRDSANFILFICLARTTTGVKRLRHRTDAMSSQNEFSFSCFEL